MSYATVQNLVDRFGEVEIARLTTAEGQPVDAIDAAAAQLALDDATAEIESYLRKRYATPVAAPVPQELVRACALIARYNLSFGEQKQPSEQTTRQREQIVAWLRDISAGKVLLDLATAPSDYSFAQAADRMDAQMTTRGAVFGVDNVG